MKKHLTIFAMIIATALAAMSSCCQTIEPQESRPARSQAQTAGSSEKPATIRNPDCEPVTHFRVFQVHRECALAYATWGTPRRNNYNPDSNEIKVCLPIKPGSLYYDDQRIEVPEGKCVIYTGTYQYRRPMDIATVPVVEFIDSRIPNPE